MNNRILLVAAVAGLAIIIGIVGFSGQLIINDVSEGGIIQMSEHGSTGVKPLIMDLEELDISYVDASKRTGILFAKLNDCRRREYNGFCSNTIRYFPF